MAMGLTACKPADWIELDDRYGPEMAERRTLLADRHADVFAALPTSDDARREVLEILANHLPHRYPDWFQRDGGQLRNRLTGEDWNLAAPSCDPLELAGRLIQEDLCLIQPGPEGPLLTAAVLCFPSRWRLAEKIGRPLAGIHGPVPLYADRLAAPVDRFMDRVKTGHIAARLNWSVLDDPTLFQTGGKYREGENASITADNAGETLFLRVERQTLRRLPRSQAVLFTIRVHVYPLSRIAVRREAAVALARAVRELPDAIGRYKSLGRLRAALLAYLDRAAG
jgi:dimethylamine monooxygenase subunit A